MKYLQILKRVVGPSVLLVYGKTGSLKSKFCFQVTIDALQEGSNAYYIDTERNLSDDDISVLGRSYRFTPVWSEIQDLVRRLGKYDLLILDSLGMPAMVNWSRMNMKKRGEARLQEISMLGDLKDWAYRNDALVVVTTQPESEFGVTDKSDGQDPVGGKGLFVAKEIWQTELTAREPNVTRGVIKARRSRVMGTGTVVATLDMTAQGLDIKSGPGLKAYFDRGNGKRQQKPQPQPAKQPPENAHYPERPQAAQPRQKPKQPPQPKQEQEPKPSEAMVSEIRALAEQAGMGEHPDYWEDTLRKMHVEDARILLSELQEQANQQTQADDTRAQEPAQGAPAEQGGAEPAQGAPPEADIKNTQGAAIPGGLF